MVHSSGSFVAQSDEILEAAPDGRIYSLVHIAHRGWYVFEGICGAWGADTGKVYRSLWGARRAVRRGRLRAPQNVAFPARGTRPHRNFG